MYRKSTTPLPPNCTCKQCGIAFHVRPVRAKTDRAYCTRNCFLLSRKALPKVAADPGERFWSKVRKTETCWTWTGITNLYGYGLFRLNGKRVLAHRFVLTLVNGVDPTGMVCCHKCDNPACVRPDHLFLGTHADNVADRTAKGRSARGSKSGVARLTEEQIPAIRSLYREQGIRASEIARRFNVSSGTIEAVLRGVTWTHVP